MTARGNHSAKPKSSAAATRRANLLREAMAMPPSEWSWLSADPGRVTVTINRLPTKPETNTRAGWRADAKARKTQHERVALALWYASGACRNAGARPDVIAHGGAPAVVTLTRLASRELDDDNWVSAAKAVRDAVARWFGVDDGPKGPIRWSYGQRKRRVPGVEIVLAWDSKD